MKKVQSVAALKAGWRSFMRRPGYLFGISLAFIALLLATSGNGAMFMALSSIVMAGVWALWLMHYDGAHIQFDDVVSIKDTWISFTFVTIIKTVGIMLGLLLFIVPGVYLALRWMFAELLVIDKGMRPMEALRESARITEGNKWRLLGFVLLSMLVLLVGFVALVIGVIAASAVVTLALIHIYRELSSTPAVVVPMPEKEPVLE